MHFSKCLNGTTISHFILLPSFLNTQDQTYFFDTYRHYYQRSQFETCMLPGRGESSKMFLYQSKHQYPLTILVDQLHTVLRSRGQHPAGMVFRTITQSTLKWSWPHRTTIDQTRAWSTWKEKEERSQQGLEMTSQTIYFRIWSRLQEEKSQYSLILHI